MEENEATELLNKLKSFMENTNKQIETLINRTHNLGIDVDNLKKIIIRENRIIVKH